MAARMHAQVEACAVACEEQWQKLWHSEAEEKVRPATSSLRVVLVLLEMDRDEGGVCAAAAGFRVQELDEQNVGSHFLPGPPATTGDCNSREQVLPNRPTDQRGGG